MDSFHGDCGHELRWWSFVAILEIAGLVALAICWPRPKEATPQKWRWLLSGTLAGALAGLLISSFLVRGWRNAPLAGSALCGAIVAGAMVGKALFHARTRGGTQFTLGLRTLLLLPVALAPLLVALLPVLPYEDSISTTSPFHFMVVDATGRPIPNAAVRLVDPRFALDDAEHQGERVVTASDGTAEYFLSATSRVGRGCSAGSRRSATIPGSFGSRPPGTAPSSRRWAARPRTAPEPSRIPRWA